MKRCFFVSGLLCAVGLSFLPMARSQVVIKKMIAVRLPAKGIAVDKTVAEKHDSSPPPPTVLRWNNGESLSGEIGEATEADLTWKTPCFEDPLSLSWAALHRIDRTLPEVKTTDSFALALRDGSYLYGDLVGVTADGVTLHSTRHGDVTLRRTEVLSARRIRSRRLLFAGPLGDAGWTPAPSGGAPEYDALLRMRGSDGPTQETPGSVPPWMTGPGGSLVLPYFDRAALLRLPLPDRVEAEFRVSAHERPAFAFSLVDEARGRLRVETWGDQLVLAAGDGFTVLRTLEGSERNVALRVCFDRRTRHCQAYTTEGQFLKEWTAPEDKRKDVTGITLRNKGRALVLEFLRVNEWDGRPPTTEMKGDPPRVETDEGQVTAGQVDKLEGGMISVVPTSGDAPPLSLPLEAVNTIIFSGDAPKGDGNATTLSFVDGTYLQGQIVSIKDGEATLRTRFTEAPLPAKIGEMRQLFVRAPVPPGNPPEPALQTLDRLVLGDVTLHGRLQVAGDALPHWLPVGGTRPATPARSAAYQIFKAVKTLPESTGETSLFYTRAGDAIPGKLHGMDRKEVVMESSIIESKNLSADTLEAVQFSVNTGGSVRGFDAPEWQVLRGPKGEVQKSDKLNLVEGAMVGHPSAMQNGEVRFNYDTTNFSCLRLRMFCDGTDPAKGTSYLLFRMGGSMTTGIEPSDGQFMNQNRTTLKNGSTAVRLVIDDAGVRCYLNEILAETVPLPAARRAGSGLILEPTSLWGNSITAVPLSGFSVNSEPGQVFLPVSNADAKAQALTVPRFRKEDPPRQILLAANGDLLRGEVEAITNTQFGFRVGLEELYVPRERVKAVVLLQKPTDQPPPPAPEEDAIHKALDQKLERQFWYTRANLQTLISVLKQQVPELKFKLPTEKNSRYVQYHFTTTTIGEALDGICDLFGVHYRIEKDEIVIDAKPPRAAEELLRTVYWLKPKAFGGKDSPETMLTAKGIPFAEGSSAKWQEGSQCLVVVNTPANQAKLVAVLNQDFGGVLGSPTHWLRLTNGGQIGLAVEAFDPEAVRGTHPIYGRCRVPMSEVYTIRNTLPEPTAARRVATGWQLVYAPEPVLPESGGEGSALLGKTAPLFKLKMLDGGDDFELAKEKGHIVVLDFWATWCGPCIKSLPGLIETMAQFPADRVRLVGLNQAEPPEQVKRFLNTRGWKLAVAMDAGQNVATQYGVEGIPHTVIVGPDGKVAWVRTGVGDDNEEVIAAAVKKLLSAETPAVPTAGAASATETVEVAQK